MRIPKMVSLSTCLDIRLKNVLSVFKKESSAYCLSVADVRRGDTKRYLVPTNNLVDFVPEDAPKISTKNAQLHLH